MLGVVLFGVDLLDGLPLWWNLLEGLGNSGSGILILSLTYRAGRQSQCVSSAPTENACPARQLSSLRARAGPSVPQVTVRANELNLAAAVCDLSSERRKTMNARQDKACDEWLVLGGQDGDRPDLRVANDDGQGAAPSGSM